MKKVIRFTRIRFIMFALSFVVIAAGFLGLTFRNGLNLGIDFTGGLNKQIQIAPVAFTLAYTGEGLAETNVLRNLQYPAGALQVTVTRGGAEETLSFDFREYGRLGGLVGALARSDGFGAELLADADIATERVISLNYAVDISKETLTVNYRLVAEEPLFAPIADMRSVLSDLGRFSLQVVGAVANQEFILKVSVPERADREFLQEIDSRIADLLGGEYGSEKVIIKKADFVDPVFSADLVTGAMWSLIVAFVLILAYITIRFKFVFAVGAILALVHDVSVMVGVIAVFQLEVTSATIAAFLTIIGYSLNDTIVVFDRVRENTALMLETGRGEIIDVSISQSLSRTTITSLTTLLAVVAIYVFGTGAIKDFAFNLIIGVVVGTYSSIFIASPFVLGVQNVLDRRRRAGDRKRQERDVKTTTPGRSVSTAAARAAAASKSPGAVKPAPGTPAPAGSAVGAGGAPPSEQGGARAVASGGQAPAAAGVQGQPRRKPGRKKKKRKRR